MILRREVAVKRNASPDSSAQLCVIRRALTAVARFSTFPGVSDWDGRVCLPMHVLACAIRGNG
jgi:hypothetical protein